jgi:tRNA splicing endonuclease
LHLHHNKSSQINVQFDDMYLTMPPPTTLIQFIIEDSTLAQTLRTNRLLTSSLRHEPTFKHENIDDPDEVLAFLEENTPKKARKVKRFNFQALLPLVITYDEAFLAFELQHVCFQRISSHICRVVKWNEDLIIESKQALLDCVVVAGTTGGMDINRASVFKTLWECGYTMVDGLKFGVHFLAYQGDPLKTHANYMVLVVDPNVSPLSMMDATALCTLAAKTRKIAILGWLNVEMKKAQFIQLLREPVNVMIDRFASQEEQILDEIPTANELMKYSLGGGEETTPIVIEDENDVV